MALSLRVVDCSLTDMKGHSIIVCMQIFPMVSAKVQSYIEDCDPQNDQNPYHVVYLHRVWICWCTRRAPFSGARSAACWRPP